MPNGQVCGHVFTHYPIDAVPIVGKSKDETVRDFVLNLMKHMEKHHPKDLAAIILMSQNFIGYMVLRYFETQDTLLAEKQGQIAAFLRSVSRLYVSDDEITEAVVRLGFTMEDPARQGVTDAMKHMRDYLTESPSKTQTGDAAESRVIG
jgi:hypothetical protein